MSTSFGWEGKGRCGSFFSGWTRGVHVILWDPLRTRAIPECLRGVITTRRCTNPRSPYLTLPYLTSRRGASLHHVPAGVPEKHGDADVRHVATDGLPRLGDDKHLALAERHLDGVLELGQTQTPPWWSPWARSDSDATLMESLSSVRLRRRPSLLVIVHWLGPLDGPSPPIGITCIEVAIHPTVIPMLTTLCRKCIDVDNNNNNNK